MTEEEQDFEEKIKSIKNLIKSRFGELASEAFAEVVLDQFESTEELKDDLDLEDEDWTESGCIDSIKESIDSPICKRLFKFLKSIIVLGETPVSDIGPSFVLIITNIFCTKCKDD